MGCLVKALSHTEYIKYIDKSFKFIFQIHSLLKFLLFFLHCKNSDLSMRTLWLVRTVPQKSHPNPSSCSLHYVNHFVSQFELFIRVFGYCWCQHWRQVLIFTNVFSCNDQLIPQSHKLVENCLSHCKILYQSKLFPDKLVENFEFFIQVVGVTFGPRK